MVTPKNNPTPPKNIKLSQHTINLITNLQDSSSLIIILLHLQQKACSIETTTDFSCNFGIF